MTGVFGEWQVTGTRIYRGHLPGEQFEAQISNNAAARAVARGDIILLREVMPKLQDGSYMLPQGWATSQSNRKRSR